jgi:glycosyltransferase involved in cell wall biosynthesis
MVNLKIEGLGLKKAAHFLLWPELACSPPNDAIVSALLELGYSVDLYAPGNEFCVSDYGSLVSAKHVEYGRRWFLKNLFLRSWKKYKIFSGTSEDPMAAVGLLSFIHRRPCFCLADEIYSGSYRGDRSGHWKKLCRWGMRKASLHIVNDLARIKLQKEYAKLSNDCKVIVYPGCFRSPPEAVDKKKTRQRWGIPENAFVIGHSGWFNVQTGADYIIKALSQNKSLFVVLQPMEMNETVSVLLDNIKGRKRLYFEKSRIGWRESWATMASADIGVVIYRSQAPQFNNMGISSNKLCMFIAMGVPIIASRQKSFEFIEAYNCGVLIENYGEFLSAIEKIRTNYMDYKKNTMVCAKEYIKVEKRYADLAKHIADLVLP